MQGRDPINPYETPKTTKPEKPKVADGVSVLKDLRPLGWLAITAILIQLVANLASASTPKRPDLVMTLIVVQAVTLLFASLTFLAWVFLAASNALRINPRSNIRPIWSACCYIIPFANFVCPLLEMRKVVRETFRSSSANSLQIIVVVWWISFLTRALITKAGVSIEVMTVWVAASIVSAASVIFLILRISAKQAKFQWTEYPSVNRPVMQPLGGRRANLPPKRSAPILPDVEDNWG